MITTIKDNIRFTEIGQDKKVSIGKIIDRMQDCSNYQSELLGLGMDNQLKTKKAWILSSWNIRINRRPDHGREVLTSTWPTSFSKCFGRRNYTIAYSEEPENYIVEAEAVWVLYDIEKQMLARISEKDMEKYECDKALNLECPSRKIKKAFEYEKKDGWKVEKYHLDINNHMNNAWYIKLSTELLENEDCVKNVRIEYKKSAVLGDFIYPYVCYDKDRCVVELRSEKDEVFSIAEFQY